MFNIGYRGANTQGEEYTIIDKCKFAEHTGFYFLVRFKETVAQGVSTTCPRSHGK